MPNLRIVSDNAADRATLTTTPSAVTGLGVSHLRTDIKSQLCRVMGDTVQIVATWADAEPIGCVAIPSCSLSASAVIRVRCYADAAGTDEVYDSGELDAAPGVTLASWDFTQDINVNAFWGGPATVAVWLNNHVMAERVVIDITDPDASRIDIARLVVGRWFELTYQPAYGSAWGIEDTSSNTRAESGDIKTDAGTQHRSLSLDLGWVHAADRHRVAQIMRQGIGKRHFVATFPDAPDVGLEQDWMLYGVLRQPSDAAFFAPGLHQTVFQFQEW